MRHIKHVVFGQFGAAQLDLKTLERFLGAARAGETAVPGPGRIAGTGGMGPVTQAHACNSRLEREREALHELAFSTATRIFAGACVEVALMFHMGEGIEIGLHDY
jgi:hypothetical protein